MINVDWQTKCIITKHASQADLYNWQQLLKSSAGKAFKDIRQNSYFRMKHISNQSLPFVASYFLGTVKFVLNYNGGFNNFKK